MSAVHPKELSIKDYTYELPLDRIARYPLDKRDQSRLLIYDDGAIQEDIYHHLAQHIPDNSFLVFNNTKVVEARLAFQKPNGGAIEIFCLEPDDRYPDITTAMLQKEKVWWKCLVGGAKKWKEGAITCHCKKDDRDIIITATKENMLSDSYTIQLSWNAPALSFAEILHAAGQVPIPPYLDRQADTMDKERYQTIYAKFDGSVAAPTAGLHFTDAVFGQLAEKNIQHDFVSLHVGAGTFKPVKAGLMQDHEMHAEFIDVSKSFIENLLQQLEGNIIAVGTTSLRTIESLYWLGAIVTKQPSITPTELYLTQWEPYENDTTLTAAESLNGLLTWMQQHSVDRLLTRTQIIIAPGYRFRIIRGLITNFHQPQSTLLLLVAALIGDDWKKVYAYALEHGFRFLSYGDGSLLWKK